MVGDVYWQGTKCRWPWQWKKRQQVKLLSYDDNAVVNAFVCPVGKDPEQDGYYTILSDLDPVEEQS